MAHGFVPRNSTTPDTVHPGWKTSAPTHLEGDNLGSEPLRDGHSDFSPFGLDHGFATRSNLEKWNPRLEQELFGRQKVLHQSPDPG